MTGQSKRTRQQPRSLSARVATLVMRLSLPKPEMTWLCDNARELGVTPGALASSLVSSVIVDTMAEEAKPEPAPEVEAA